MFDLSTEHIEKDTAYILQVSCMCLFVCCKLDNNQNHRNRNSQLVYYKR